jgi:hydrogenase expression/formation protein HypC
VSIDGTIAVIDFGGVQRETNVSLVEVKPGDYVIVHAGFAIQAVDELDALETIKLWEELLASQEQS